MTKDRPALIKQRLEAALQPSELTIVDESHLHQGHAGAATGLGHFRVTIVASQFTSCNLLARHRLVYAAVGDLMQTDIHALSIEARAPDE